MDKELVAIASRIDTHIATCDERWQHGNELRAASAVAIKELNEKMDALNNTVNGLQSSLAVVLAKLDALADDEPRAAKSPSAAEKPDLTMTAKGLRVLLYSVGAAAVGIAGWVANGVF